jgi:hypothetical protein
MILCETETGPFLQNLPLSEHKGVGMMSSCGYFNEADNNHNFESLTIPGDGDTSYVLMQAAINPESGSSKKTARYTRSVKYDIAVPTAPRYAREFVGPLQLYNDPHGKGLQEPQGCNRSGNIPPKTDRFYS